MAKVHIDSPVEVDLEMKDGDDWVTVCTSPCGVAVRTSGTYRINGSGVRASKPFQLEEATTTKLTVEPAWSLSRPFGIALVVAGGAGLVPAVGVTGLVVAGVAVSAFLVCPLIGLLGVEYIGCVADIALPIAHLYAEPVVWIPAVAGLVPIFAGGALLASSGTTRVKQSVPFQLQGAARAPEWRVPSELAALGPSSGMPTIPLARFTF